MNGQPQALTLDADGDRRAAHLAGGGATLGQIAAQYDPPLSNGAVKAAIARGRHQLNRQAPKPAPVVRPAPVVVPVAPVKPERSVPLEPNELLAWAERDGPTRARTLAARVRQGLAELAQLHEQHAATAQKRAAVAALEKQLAAAKAQLRELTSAKAQPAARSVRPDGEKAELARIRAWARDQGHGVAERGRIPSAIVEAYRAAHAGSGTGR